MGDGREDYQNNECYADDAHYTHPDTCPGRNQDDQSDISFWDFGRSVQVGDFELGIVYRFFRMWGVQYAPQCALLFVLERCSYYYRLFFGENTDTKVKDILKWNITHFAR